MRRIIFFIVISLICSTGFAQKITGTLKKIADSGTFTIGYRDDSKPFSYLDSSGVPIGYSIDLCKRIAVATRETLGLAKLDIKYVKVSAKDRFDAVESGKVDIECGATTITLSRLERVDFTMMTFVTGGSLLSKKSDPIQMTGDLGGKSVAVLKNTTTMVALKEYLHESLIDATIVEVDNGSEGMEQLESGKVQALARDQVVLIGQVLKTVDPKEYVLSEDLFSFEPYGFMIRRNDSAFRLVTNRSLAQLYRTEQYQPLYNKWFGSAGVRPSPVLAAMYKMQSLPE
jgi:glutamate/aspartate transport system substrate-binding protein